MSGERLRQGVLHPVDLVQRLGVRAGSQVLALGVPRMYMAALHAAVGPAGRLQSVLPRRDELPRPRGREERPRRGSFSRDRPLDLAILWDDREQRFDELAARALPALPSVVWLLVLRPGKRPAPGSMTLPEAELLLPGYRCERTVSLGDRYALRFERIPIVEAPAQTLP